MMLELLEAHFKGDPPLDFQTLRVQPMPERLGCSDEAEGLRAGGVQAASRSVR